MKPYYFSFTSHAKGRWVGYKVYDVFCREFQAQKPEYYVSWVFFIFKLFTPFFSTKGESNKRWKGDRSVVLYYIHLCTRVLTQTLLKRYSHPVNSETATMETVLQHNDLLVHQVHRHEPPVTAQPISIIHQDDHILAVNKPPSIPVRSSIMDGGHAVVLYACRFIRVVGIDITLSFSCLGESTI